eukprot:ANDGO_06838.mRNA.1 Endoplasmic reticulum oxidoreductin-2
MMGKRLQISVALFSLVSLSAVVYGSVMRTLSSALGPMGLEFRELEVANEWRLYPLLNEYSASRDFKYFYAELDRACPFWVQDVMCMSNPNLGLSACSVCPCEDGEFPKDEYEDPKVDRSILLSSLNQQQSQQSQQQQAQQGSPPQEIQTTDPNTYPTRTSEDLAWVTESMNPNCVAATSAAPASFAAAFGTAGTVPTATKGVWLDLTRNLESNTGFAGGDARRVWYAIYAENCAACGDETFLKLVSGLHHSITIQIARNYAARETVEAALLAGPKTEKKKNGASAPVLAPNSAPTENLFEDLMLGSYWGYFLPSKKLYVDRIQPFPDRLQNLLFTYAFVLRAIDKLVQMTRENPHVNPKLFGYSGARIAALETISDAIPETLRAYSFRLNETNVDRMRYHFRNITDIMDCVACEKCKLWGKLQFLGLGTALRIMTFPYSPGKDKNGIAAPCLSVNELVALLNIARKLADSVESVRLMDEYLVQEATSGYVFFAMLASSFVVVLYVLVRCVLCCRPKSKSKTKKL